MDNKAWLWRKKSSEKIIVAADKSEHEEMLPPSEKEVALEQSVEDLDEKLASLFSECNAKDELLANYAVKSQKAVAGQEKAEAEAVILKQELDEALQQKAAANDSLTHLNTALKDYMQQLNCVKEEQDQRVHDAITKTTKEYEKSNKKLSTENSHLRNALLVKEELIEEFSKRMSIAEVEFNTLMCRLDSTEKENAFLKYEFHMLEKELEIRNEEIHFNRRSADASAKKVKKLESECQRLHILVRKRVPGPAEESRRKKGNVVENLPGVPSKRVSFLIDQLCDMEEHNKILKDVLGKKDDEILSLRTQIEELRNVKKLAGASSFDMSLMDDFVEMEKLAIVSVDDPSQNSNDVGYTLSNSKECKELVPVTMEYSSEKPKLGDWLQKILNMIFEQNSVSKRSLDEILEDIKTSLQSTDKSRPKLGGYISWKSPISSPKAGSLKEEFKSVNCLEAEVGMLKESKRKIEDEIENQKFINEELDTELTVAKAKMHEVLKKVSSLEVELEEKNRSCEELETTCLEVQLQLESVNNKEFPRNNVDQEEKLVHTGWEITAATAKLAECQETIFSLGKQLKALSSSSPNESAASTNLLSTTKTNNSKDLKEQRSCLRDQMLAEDGVEYDDDYSTSPKTKEIIISTQHPNKASNVGIENPRTTSSYSSNTAGSLAIVPTKKRSGGISFLRKLLLRRNKSQHHSRLTCP